MPPRAPIAIIDGMTLKVDKAGRVVLPKVVRDRLRLRAGSGLTLEERAEGILLRPIGRRASLIEKGGLLIHRGEAPKGFDWERMVADQRDERIQDIYRL